MVIFCQIYHLTLFCCTSYYTWPKNIWGGVFLLLDAPFDAMKACCTFELSLSLPWSIGFFQGRLGFFVQLDLVDFRSLIVNNIIIFPRLSSSYDSEKQEGQ